MHAQRVKAASTAMGGLTQPGDPDYQSKLDNMNKALQDQEDFLSGKPGASAAKAATPAIVQQYLQKAGGDKDKTRAALKKDGYTF